MFENAQRKNFPIHKSDSGFSSSDGQYLFFLHATITTPGIYVDRFRFQGKGGGRNASRDLIYLGVEIVRGGCAFCP